jgi:hypothetical protein
MAFDHDRRAFTNRRGRAKAKGIRWDLTYEDLGPAPECCPCCGVVMERGDENGGRGTAPSLDRLLPEAGYIKGNVVWICHNCNGIKHDAGPADLYRVADWLWEEYKRRGIPLPETQNRRILKGSIDETTETEEET